jgi:hypothetical protein
VLYTNLDAYFAIAIEAWEEAKVSLDRHTSPKPDGTGFIRRLDPSQRSFKQSMIAIAFAGVYLESLLFVVGSQRLGRSRWLQYHEFSKYESKLELLGVTDAGLLEGCKRLRMTRKGLMHEKAAADLSEGIRVAQDEAEHAIQLIREISALLRPNSAAGASSN